MKRSFHWNALRAFALIHFVTLGSAWTGNLCVGQEKANFDLVQSNKANEPRFTPLTRPAMKQYIEELKFRTPRIPLPDLSEDDKKKSLEDNRQFGYESRIRALYLNDGNGNNYLTFGGSPAGGFGGGGAAGAGAGGGGAGAGGGGGGNRPNNPTDPIMSLDYGFKTRMFWIAARANNCQYCLGHQESKLLGVGMTEDAIAALDSNWDEFPKNEQVAFSLAKKLTQEPYLVGDADIDACRPFYSDVQIIEMLGSVSGNNAINRWKEGSGTPQSSGGGNFGRPNRDAAVSTAAAPPSPSREAHSYLTPTSEKYLSVLTKVGVQSSEAPSAKASVIAPTRSVRPALETGDTLKTALDKVATRKSRLQLTSVETAREVMGDLVTTEKVPTWMRLLAHFPVAGKRMATGFIGAQKSDELSPALQSEINWVVARQDRSWYAARLAADQMNTASVAEPTRKALDGDLNASNPAVLPDRDRALLIVAKNLAASPIVLTDQQVADAVKIAGPRAVVQTINYTAYRAAFDRITEAALLPLE